jgi:N-acetyltransferase
MLFDFQPRLSSDLLETRPLAADDFDGLYAVAADPLLWEQHPDEDRWRPDGFRAFFAESLASGGALAVVDGCDRRVIGSSRYHGYDPYRSEVEIGWRFLARSRWGGGGASFTGSRLAPGPTSWNRTTESYPATDLATNQLSDC